MAEDRDEAALLPGTLDGMEPEARYSPPSELFQGLYYLPGNRPGFVGVSGALTGEKQQVNGESYVRARMCYSQAELAMNMGLKLDGNLAIGETGSANAKIEFLNSLNMSMHDLFIAVYARRVPFELVGQNPRFKPGVSPSQPNFAQYYGTAWASRIVAGSEFYLVYRFRAFNSTQRTQIINTLTAKGALLGGTLKFNAGFDAVMQSVTAALSTTLDFRITGLSNPNFFNPETDKVWKFCADFLQRPVDAPWILGLDWSPYSSVPRD